MFEIFLFSLKNFEMCFEKENPRNIIRDHLFILRETNFIGIFKKRNQDLTKNFNVRIIKIDSEF